MDNLTRVSFQIIAAVGGARSSYVEAIRAAKNGDFDAADELVKKGDESFIEGHDAHNGLIQQEAGGDPVNMTLIITHAEDQLMAAETFKTVALELIDVYRQLSRLEAGGQPPRLVPPLP
ncbi:MAG: PTS lactose/cellobiose transporter subunit IIA [Coriobacteriaceae bacterium]|uniref:PTS lactose/cellobiose transporter subunit IIA n=1 Tax=Tractidigestivibacter sp. TaxID=2847320 RepID=UPI002A83419B|nr:PTS lactose/cellobiose transporter subunit IIA [Tractidigestivibacter sp.]MCI6273708.1 PTS lactose/cellobiose transporter subunit IIA [Coriobacteriaceae bacterium]MCI6548335.1 PTS lactose/cellobiose transporter subunit IIA [Coriobacteriaceae bacterium]MCI6844326.1 PTS lactose/cellobiose transporter subunit IIA [Coriobacteriaceae bacterium]MCI7438081.1 PTS lactose/cellobiose transporter subunit IIA [Coriobacteriaceae bacterium]MDD7584617.1 PTS lactose/cellobiose transporter subunit IIA [Cori